MARKACPALKFEVTALTPNGFKSVQKKLPDGTTGVRVFALVPGKADHVGELTLRVETINNAHPLKKHIKGNDFLEPTWAKAGLRQQGCGIGTALYTRAAEVAKASKLPLVSSRERSSMSEGFWAKQAKKGRAVCLPNQPGAYSSKGEYVPGLDQVVWDGDSWPCWRYVLKAGKTDLSGPKRQRR